MTLWGSRFSGETEEAARRFGDSIGFDRRLYAADLQGSLAYAGALARAGLITPAEREAIAAGLEQVRLEFEAGTFQVRPTDEDIHTAVERRLGELIGDPAGKLHTGRSRNDQVATDLRLYLLEEIAILDAQLTELQTTLVDQAEAHLEVIVPGYTHLQPAQPVLFSHWLLSFFWKLQRDRERLADAARRTRVCPLGSGALAGNPFAVDREELAAELGFAIASENSIDAVSDRDFVVEFLAWAALIQVHLSNLAEDLILWSSAGFGFVRIADGYATGSSLMPHKRNPDTLELMRAKSGRLTGHLVGLLTTLKGLPSAYNKDLQEDKQGLFDTVDTLKLELDLATGIIATLEVDEDRAGAALDDGLLATDLAEHLVRQGVPFRQSHHLVGLAVQRAEEQGVGLRELDPAAAQAIHPALGEDLNRLLDFRRSVEARRTKGGTASKAVRAQIERARRRLDDRDDAQKS